mgnify:CR=1 FL=1
MLKLTCCYCNKNISNVEKQKKQNNIKAAYCQSKRWLHFYTCNHCEKSHNYNKVIPLSQAQAQAEAQAQAQAQAQTPLIKTTTTIKTTTFKEEP